MTVCNASNNYLRQLMRIDLEKIKLIIHKFMWKAAAFVVANISNYPSDDVFKCINNFFPRSCDNTKSDNCYILATTS